MPKARRKLWAKMVQEQKNAETPDDSSSSEGRYSPSAYKESTY